MPSRPDASESATFEQFVATRGPSLLRFCTALTGSLADGEDLLQESLARSYVRWRKISSLEFVDAYVRRIIATQHATARRRRGLILTSFTDDQFLPHTVNSADLDLREALRVALHQLPPRQRIAMVLTYLEDLSDGQIATIMNCSINTVKSHRAKGLKHLRAVLPSAALRD